MNAWLLIIMINVGAGTTSHADQVVFIEDNFNSQAECLQQGKNISGVIDEKYNRDLFFGKGSPTVVKCIPSVKMVSR